MSHVVAASVHENAAIELDRKGDVPGALRKYEECERELKAAIDAALPAHAEDHPKLVQHRKEVLDRVGHLKGLKAGAQPTLSVEDQIKAVQLGMQASSAASDAAASAGGVKTLAACAALGAAGSCVVLGGTLGLGIAAAGGAAAAGYAATRSDKIGDAARTAGGLAITAADKAVALNREHHLTEKALETGGKAVEAAKLADQKYGITDKAQKAAGAALSKAQEVEQKHQVTSKVASGLAFGMGKISAALDGAISKGQASGASGASAGK